jgi:methylmalonyl-CoA/ethylmalonyl-CoA epimerase
VSLPDLQCFHIAFVVRDIDETIENWKELLGPSEWHIWDARPGGTRPAYGRAAGQTWELWEAKGQGDSAFHRFLEKHGEGVQHIGFWVDDIRAAVEAALDGGAKLQVASQDAAGNAVVQLLPRASVTEENLDNLGLTAFFEGSSFGDVRIEYCSHVADNYLKESLGERYGTILEPPPWGR